MKSTGSTRRALSTDLPARPWAPAAWVQGALVPSPASNVAKPTAVATRVDETLAPRRIGQVLRWLEAICRCRSNDLCAVVHVRPATDLLLRADRIDGVGHVSQRGGVDPEVMAVVCRSDANTLGGSHPSK